MNKTQKIYFILSIVCIMGIIWIVYAINNDDTHKATQVNLCFFKQITSLPCPSCGSTRAVVCLFKGQILQSLQQNPLGIVSTSMFVVLLLLLIYDLIFHDRKLLHTYTRAEKLINKKPIAIALILLLALNWIWNIHKGL